MKVYIYYLRYPTKWVNDNGNIDDINRMKDIISNCTFVNRRYVETVDDYIYLYAHTTNKKYAKRFVDERNMDLFIEVIKDMDDDEYVSFRHDVVRSELMTESLLSNGGKTCDVLITSEEKIDINDNCMIYIDDLIYGCTTVSYEVFKDKYIKALDAILYCTDHKINMDDDDDSYSYNWGYGQTAASYYSGVRCEFNLFELFIKYYAILFR